MSKKKPTAKERYEELMRNAPKKMRALNRAALERERLYRNRYKAGLTYAQRAEADTTQRKIERIETELAILVGRLGSVRGQRDRVLLEAEITHLREIKRRLIGAPRRKPPESGLPVPAMPPRGPAPKSGGAEAPLEFD